MWRSLFLSSISLAFAACSDDAACGPGGASATGIIASGDNTTLTFGNLTGGLNNDCPADGAPQGVVSLTISGTQTDGTGTFTLCVERPDLLAKGEQALGSDIKGSPVHVVDVKGTFNSCSYKVDKTRLPTGMASSKGLCGNGSDTHGFAIVVDGAVPLTRTCGATIDSVSVTLAGTVAVLPM